MATSKAVHMTGSKVLVVDDEPTVREVVVGYLRRDGHEVAEAGDGYTALELLDSDPPDLVVLDFAMPEFDGEEVMRRLRADPRTAGVPLLLATASEIELPTIQRASGLLRKPYPREVLFEMIERLLGEASG